MGGPPGLRSERAGGRRARELGDAFKEQSAGLVEALRQPVDTVEGASAGFRQSGDQLLSGARATMAQVQDAVELFRTEAQVLASVSEQAAEIGTIFVDQAQALADSANEAEAQAKVIRQNAFESRRDTFLRASRFVIEDLNSIAIDLNRLLDTQGSQRLWSKLTKGDKRIFVRTMLSDDEKHAREVIRAKFEGDENFRKYVQRYLDHFERLLNQASESDPENLLSSTFLSADIGKLYLVLARSVGRLN